MLEAERQQIYSELSSKSKDELLDLLMRKIIENDSMKAREAANEKVYQQIALDYARNKEEVARLRKENRVLKEQNEHLTSIRGLQAKDLYGRSSEKTRDLLGEELPDDPLSEAAEESSHDGKQSREPSKEPPASGKPSSDRKGASDRHRKGGRKPADRSRMPHHTTYDFNADTIAAMDKKFGKGCWTIKFWRHHEKAERLRPVTYIETTYEPIIGYGDNQLYALPYPDDLLPGSILSQSLATSLMYGKFGMGLPFDRQIKDLETDGLFLTEQTVTVWAEKLTELYLNPVKDYMALCLKSRPYSQCDETTEQILRDGRAAGSKSYIWVHVTSELDGGPPLAVFCYERGRSAEHLRKFFGEDSRVRVITCDAYCAYQTYEKERQNDKEGTTAALFVTGCWMHARRRWARSLALVNTKKMSQEQVDSLPESKALKLIGAIYHDDGRLKTMTVAERYKQRQKKVLPLVDAYFEFIHSFDQADPSLGEKARDAISYSANQEKYLRRFLTDGNIPCDDGFTERCIRSFATGRRSWLFNCTERGAKAAMTYYTLIETARLNGANPYIYLQYLFEETPKQAPFFSDKKAVRQLMPWSARYRQYEKDELAKTLEQFIPEDDKKPHAPKRTNWKKITLVA